MGNDRVEFMHGKRRLMVGQAAQSATEGELYGCVGGPHFVDSSLQ